MLATILVFLMILSLSLGFIKNNYRSKPRFCKCLILQMSNDGIDNGISLRSTVEKCVTSNTKGPYLSTFTDNQGEISISIDPNITLITDILKCEGCEDYEKFIEQWNQVALPELYDSKFGLTRVSSLQPNVVTINWNVTFIPDTLTTIVWWSKLLRLRLQYFNVLDKERIRSSFSWKAFQLFLNTIVNEGIVKLPHAVIVGTTEFRFVDDSNNDNNDDDSNIENKKSSTNTIRNTDNTIIPKRRKKYKLISSKESLQLIRSIDNNILQNRKLATDLLEFIDARRPMTIGLNEWNDIITTRINTRSVPGMGQFDIDGLEGKQQSEILDIANRVIGAATLIVLLFGSILALSLINKLFLYPPTTPSPSSFTDTYF